MCYVNCEVIDLKIRRVLGAVCALALMLCANMRCVYTVEAGGEELPGLWSRAEIEAASAAAIAAAEEVARAESALPELVLPNIPEFTRHERMTMEKETTGLYLSGHPMDEYREAVKRARAVPIGAVMADFAREDGPETYRDEQRLTLAGVVSASKTKTTKNNTLMAYVTLEDDTGSMELLVFARVLGECGSYLKEGMAVAASGRISVRDEKEPQMLVDSVRPLGDDAGAVPEKPKGKRLYIRLASQADPLFRHIQLLLVMFPGEEPLKIKLVDTGQWMTLPCVVHPALVRELRELLGDETVVLK